MKEAVQKPQFLLNQDAFGNPHASQNLLGIGGGPVAHSQLFGFGGREGQDLAGIHNAGVAEVRVDHAFGQSRVALTGLGRGPHGGPHVGLVFVGDGFALLVDHGCCAHTGAGVHVDSVGGEGDKGPCRSGVVINPDHHRKGALKKAGPDAVGKIHPATVGIQSYEDQIALELVGLLEGQLHPPPHRCIHRFQQVHAINPAGLLCCGPEGGLRELFDGVALRVSLGRCQPPKPPNEGYNPKSNGLAAQKKKAESGFHRHNKSTLLKSVQQVVAPLV